MQTDLNRHRAHLSEGMFSDVVVHTEDTYTIIWTE